MNDVLITERAKLQYDAAWGWYFNVDPRVAVGFEAAFEKGLQSIATHPLSFVRCDPIHRVYLMQDYPYKLIYRVFEDRLTIVAVIHTSREPDAWRER